MFTALPRASATTTYWSFDDDGVLTVGQVNHGGTTSSWLCDDGPSPSDAQWTNLGTGSGLSDNWLIHGDSSATGAGWDVVKVLRGTTTITGDCAPTSGSWGALTFNAFYLDVYGDDGNDDASAGGGSNSSWAFGGAGNDYARQFSSISLAKGGDGNDTVFGNGGSGDGLYGEAGNDCLWDDNNTWVAYDCGSGSDSYMYGNTGAGKVSCESSSGTCCGFC